MTSCKTHRRPPLPENVVRLSDHIDWKPWGTRLDGPRPVVREDRRPGWVRELHERCADLIAEADTLIDGGEK